MKKGLSACIGILLVLTCPAPAKDEWKESLDAALKADIQLTKLSMHGTVSSTGSRYTLKVENIQAMPTDGFFPNVNIVENGSRKEAKFGTRVLTGVLNMSERKTQGLQIEPESKVGITKLKIDKDAVVVEVVTLKQEKIAWKGSTESEYLWTILNFNLRNLETMDPAEVRHVIFTALVPENNPQNSPATPVAFGAVEATPTAGSSGNDLVGKTVTELVQVLGSHYQTVTVGERTIYIFPELGLRVPVVNGKVVSAQ